MAPRSIKSAERTLRLFELFSRRQEPLTVSDVARGLAIPQPSASMLLTNLAVMGYLTYQSAARTYAPTIRVALLGGWVGPQFSGARSLASWLDDLHAGVAEDVYVGIQNGASAQIVQVRGGDHDLSIDSGQMYSLTRSAIGLALLSIKSDREVIKLVRRCNAEAAEDDRVSEADCMATVAEARRNGYAITRGYFAPGRTGVALPVTSARDASNYAVGFGGPADRMDAKLDLILQRLRALQNAAREAGPGLSGVSLAPWAPG